MRRVLLLLAFLLMGFAPAPFPKPTKPQLPKIQRIEFRMENKTWKQVFACLTEQAGKPLCGSTPSGYFTFVGPTGAKYSIPEIVIIINKGLVSRGRVLMQRERMFVIEYLPD